jgi:hypothetical protein
MQKEGLEIDITVKADQAAKEIRKITDALGGIDENSGVIEQLDSRIKKFLDYLVRFFLYSVNNLRDFLDNRSSKETL